MKKITTQKLVLAGFFLALGMVLPFVTAQIPSIGSKILPMHIPALLTGFLCGWPIGLVVGFIMPLFRSLLFTMPPMYPIAIAMAFELAAYGAVSGILYEKLGKKTIHIYAALLIAMLCGRIVWGMASLLLLGIKGSAFTWKLFVSGAFIDAIPGIIIQLVIIPVIVLSLDKVRQH